MLQKFNLRKKVATKSIKFKENYTSQKMDKLSGLCQMTMSQAIHQQMIKVYPKVDFPPNSNFTHPRHVPEKVTWESSHIQGKECVIGYVEENIFYIVFLDENNEF